MLKQDKGFGMLNAMLMMILTVGLLNHVIMIPILLSESGRDAWLGVVVSTALMAVWVPVVYVIAKRTQQQPLAAWIRERWGRTVFWVLNTPLLLCLFVMNVVTMKDTVTWTIASYLAYTPPLAVAIVLGALCCWTAQGGIQSIAYSAGILAPFVMLFGLFVMSANFPNKHYSILAPVLEHGFEPLWKCTPYVAGAFVELFLFNLFQQHIQGRIRLFALFGLLLFLMMLTVGPLLGAIVEFGPQEATRQRYPAYEEWRLVRVGKYVEHVDFLSIYQLLSGTFIRLSLLNFLMVDLLGTTRRKPRTWWLIGITAALIICAVLPISDIIFFTWLKEYYFWLVGFTLGGVSLAVLILCLAGKKEKGGAAE